MKKETALENLIVDKNFVNGLISTYGVIGAIQVLQKTFSDDMNFDHVPDPYLRIMIWQLTHSLNGLEEDANMTFDSIADIIHFGQVTDSTTFRIMCNHISGAVTSLKEYVKS